MAPLKTEDGPDTRLARLLLGSRRLDIPTLQSALAVARSEGRRLGEILVERGLVTPGELPRLLAGAPPPPESSSGALSPGEVVGAYRVTGLLGEGAMGAVYRVVEVETGRELALKLLLGSIAGEAEVERFEREAKAAARLGQRSGFVQIHSLGTHRDLPYYVMEVVEGSDLESRIDDLSPAELARVVAQVAHSLSAVHEGGFVHRDLKPANILLDQAGRPRIVDLGLVRDGQSAGLTKTGEVLGTPAYMAPEQVVDARRVDARSDVYALGAILYRGLSGRPPFVGNLISILSAVVSQAPPKPSSLRPDVPHALEAICLRALAKAAQDRYPSAADLATDLERFTSGELSAKPAPARLWLGPLILLLALAGASAAWLLQDADPRPGTTPSPTSSPTPTLDLAAITDEVRTLIQEKRFPRAMRRSRALPELPQDIRWAFALRALPLELDKVDSRIRAALDERAGRKERRVGDHQIAAVQAAYAPCHELLVGLEGPHHPAPRAQLATRLLEELGELSSHDERILEPGEAERSASLARLARVLDPERRYSPAELLALLPAYPFMGQTDHGPAIRLAKALTALAPDSPPLHVRISAWAGQDPSPEVQRALFPIVNRALELAGPEDEINLRLWRLGCLLETGQDWKTLTSEAGALLERHDLARTERARAYELRGRVSLRRKAFADAVEDLGDSLQLVDEARVRGARARAYRGLDLRQEAIADARRLLEARRPDSADTHASLVGILWDLDRQGPDLESYLERLVDHQPYQVGWRLRLALLKIHPSGERARPDLKRSVNDIARYSNGPRSPISKPVRELGPAVTEALEVLKSNPQEAKRLLGLVVAALDALRKGGAWP